MKFYCKYLSQSTVFFWYRGLISSKRYPVSGRGVKFPLVASFPAPFTLEEHADPFDANLAHSDELELPTSSLPSMTRQNMHCRLRTASTMKIHIPTSIVRRLQMYLSAILEWQSM